MGTTITRRGIPAEVEGHFPQTGQTAPPISLVDKDLNDVTLASFPGKRKILNIFPIDRLPPSLLHCKFVAEKVLGCDDGLIQYELNSNVANR